LENTSNKLSKVFQDAEMHQTIAKIIGKHLTSKEDVREKALEDITFNDVKSILDIGCGFGFFTKALSGKVSSEVRITGIDRYEKNKPHYLKACEKSGIKGNFNSNGISVIRTYDDHSYDLILCSYALYFFPEYISEIARILKKDGVFVTITHSTPHMFEFTSYVKEIFQKSGLNLLDELPFEALINNFSDKNGFELLSSSFKQIETKRYFNTLQFRQEEYEDFEKYICFKRSFFMPAGQHDELEICKIILTEIKENLKTNDFMEIGKNDMIFVCRK